jgi:putative ABC transport system ATP-binding protein
MDIIECRNVSRWDGDPSGDGRIILGDVSFAVREREIFTVIGPSGSGKSSVLRLMNRLDEPSSGEVMFRGKPLSDYPPQYVRRKISMAFQSPVLFGPKVMDDLVYPFMIDPKPPSENEIRERCAELLGLVGLGEGFIERDVDRLSGGETMRAAIARALMREPEVLLLDEPTAGLDPEAAQALLDMVSRLNRVRGLTIVVVTHRFVYARMIGHHTMLMDAGRVVEVGATMEFFERPGNEKTREYLDKERRE